MKKFIHLLCLVNGVLIAQVTTAQTPLSIPTQNHCLFSGTWEDDLYQFDENTDVQKWVKEILLAGNVTQNFEIVQASVENVAAVYDSIKGKRYLLFSQNFILKASKWEVYMALAHEIGHHTNEHSLIEARRIMEELEADQFVGYVFAKLKDVSSLEATQDTAAKFPLSYPSVWKVDDRREAIKTGWQKAEQALKINTAGFDNDPNREAFLKAQFPFPPPPCCSPREIPRTYFASAKKLGDVAQKLSNALEKQGYFYRKFLSVPDGFALVTQMEQYNDDYTCRNDQNRWSNAPISQNFDGFLDYFKRLVLPSKAYYRTFVFIITNKVFSQEGKNLTKESAGAWFGEGINRLPKTVAESLYTESATVTVLVYEFEVPESNRKPNQKCPNVDTQRHLEKSGIWQALR